jgi:hypothetical protein
VVSFREDFQVQDCAHAGFIYKKGAYCALFAWPSGTVYFRLRRPKPSPAKANPNNAKVSGSGTAVAVESAPAEITKVAAQPPEGQAVPISVNV